MKKSILGKFFAFLSLACIFLISGLFLNNDHNASARDVIEYNSYANLISSYDNFSYDYKSNQPLPVHYSLRDEYMLYTEQQSALGVCWAFASAKVLSSTIEKATKEYVDFSEAWISAALTYGDKYNELKNYNAITSTEYINGSGGYFMGFDIVAKKYGLVLEQDFRYQDSYEVSTHNSDQYFKLYSQYSSFNYIDSVNAGRFYNYENRSDKEIIKNSIKNHIIQHGAVAISTYYTTPQEISYNSKTIHCVIPNAPNGGGHLMSIIGWDDEISITYNGKTSTGAWIVLNSHGNAVGTGGDQGIVYIFYDDTNIKGDFWAYKYSLQSNQALYYHDSITQSNASYSTNLKGAYYGNMKATNGETLQKNIFFNQPNIDISYEYSLSKGSKIKDITIYRGTTDVTDIITLNHDTSENSFRITGENLATGAYKILINYGNNTANDNHINQFFICDGTEINYAYFYNNGAAVKNNGMYAIYNTYNCEEEEIIISTASQSSSFSVYFIFATYNTIQSVNANGNIFDETSAPSIYKNNIGFNFHYDVTTATIYNISFTSKTGTEKTLKIRLLYLEDETKEVLTKVHYSLDGGNNSENPRKILVSTTELTPIQNPTKNGYNFLGWYYKGNFTDPLTINDAGQYCIEYDRLFIEIPTVYFTASFNNYWKQFCNVFIYAKWEKANLVTVTFKTNGGSSVAPITIESGEFITSPTTQKLGFDFVGWFKEEELQNQWNFDDKVENNMTLYAKFILQSLKTVTLSLINEKAYVSEIFSLQLDFSHPLKDRGETSIIWQKNKNPVSTKATFIYTDIVFEQGTYSYDALITFNYENQSTEAIASLDVEVAINVNSIQIAYQDNFTFNIIETEGAISANYIVKVYKDDALLKKFSTANRVVDIAKYITSYGKFNIGVIKEYDEQVLNEVFSQSLQVFQLSYENTDTSIKPQYLLKGTKIEKTTVSRAGYDFQGWFVDNQVCKFPFSLENNTTLVAKWKLLEISEAKLSLDETVPKLYSPFELTVLFDHPILSRLKPEIEWFSNEEKIATTKIAKLSQTLTIYGIYEYYAVVNLSDNDQTVSLKTNTITFKTSVVLSEITISYDANFIYQINDEDRFASLYSIDIYLNSTLLASTTSYSKKIDISKFIITSGEYTISIEKSFAEHSLDRVYSETVTAYAITYSNTANESKYKTCFVESGYTISTPTVPAKTGYTFTNWTINGKEAQFPITVSEECQIKANWQLNNISIATISSKENQKANKPFEISLSFEHALKNTASISVEWYLNDEILETSNSTVLTQTISSSGTFSYYAIVKLSIDGEHTSQKSNLLEISLTYELSAITIDYLGNFKYSITDADAYQSSYLINILHNYKQIESFETQDKLIDLQNFVNQKGRYSITAVKTYAGQTLATVSSQNFKMIEVSFINDVDSSQISSELIEYNNNVSEPTAPSILGYSFIDWCETTHMEKAFDFTTKITRDLMIIAKYKLNNISIEKLNNIEATYNALEYTISATASHELDGGHYQYSWKKLEDPTFNIKNKDLTVKSVKDSGTYYCEISYTINDNTAYGKTNNVQVTINKAATTIDTTNLIKKYVYNGREQTILSGASVTREDEIPTIIYQNNKFKDVPKGYTLKLKISAEKTENYLASTILVDVTISPATLTVKVNDKNSFYLFKSNDFSYEIVSGTLYTGDSLNETYHTDYSVGVHSISMATNNSNYLVEIIDGKHSVTCIPHIIIASLLTLSIICLSTAIVFKSKKKKTKFN